jgi:hypothetical protein
MTKRYHLLVETPDANLAKGYQIAHFITPNFSILPVCTSPRLLHSQCFFKRQPE